MDIHIPEKIRSFLLPLGAFLASFGVIFVLLAAGGNNIFFKNHTFHFTLMFLTAFLAFYISKNLYNGYIIKRDPGAFILSLSFFTFGTAFLFHALALYHLPFFYDEMFDVTEHYGLFLGSLILIGFLVPYKKDSERLYKNRLRILAGISTFFIPGVFILATFQSFGKFLASYINSALILTGILILIVIVFLMQGYRRVANRRMSTFFIIGFSILINSAVVPFFYNEWSLVWWYFHLTFILAFIFVLAELLLHRERIEDLGDVFIYTSFGTKLVMAFSVLSAFFFVVLFNMFLTLSGDVIFKSSLNSFEMDVAEHASQSANSLSDVGSNILFISELPEIKSGVKSGNDRARMKTFFKNIISEHPAYSRLRYINEDGQEVIRVESIDRKAYIVPDKDLKSRKESYYFKEAINEEKDKIYASYMDLNAEDAGGEIKMPYIPIIRLATPAFSEKNEKRGVVIADIFGLDIISHIEYEYALNSSIFIVDQDGFYTYNKQDKRKEWGSSRDLGSGENIKNDIPDLAKYILSGRSGSIEGERDVAAYAVFFPSQKHKERFMSIVVVASKEALLAPLTGLKKKVILFGLVIVSIFIALMFFLVRRATLYIKKISDASTEIKNGDFSKRVEITTKDEMGQLAESFNAMVDKFVGLNIDLDKKVQERTSQLSESLRDIRKFQQAVDSTTDNVIILDKDLKIIYANNAWEKMTGYGARDALGKDINFSRSEKTQEKVFDKMRKTLAEGKSFSTDELMNKRKNGSEYQEYTAISPVKDNENVIFYIGISQDITRHKEIDKAKTEFVSLASHQLRTPLAIIKWYSELLLSGDAGKMTVKQKDYINEMHRGGVRMIGLVNALLNVSRIELGKLGITPEPANLSAMANSALLDFVPQIKDKKLKIKKLFEKGLPKVPVDLKLMRAIFQNLISNAVKYTPEKGEIKIGIKKENSEIVISVADTGYGIPKNQKDKIFSKLFRADNIMKKDVDGTGLGLYLVKAIVDEARGRIWFESEENKGTTFYISFPLSGMHAVSGSKDFSEEKNVV